MLRAAIGFLVVALIAAFFGFGGIADLSFDFARVLFVLFLILSIVAFVMAALQGKAPV